MRRQAAKPIIAAERAYRLYTTRAVVADPFAAEKKFCGGTGA